MLNNIEDTLILYNYVEFSYIIIKRDSTEIAQNQISLIIGEEGIKIFTFKLKNR